VQLCSPETNHRYQNSHVYHEATRMSGRFPFLCGMTIFATTCVCVFCLAIFDMLVYNHRQVLRKKRHGQHALPKHEAIIGGPGKFCIFLDIDLERIQDDSTNQVQECGPKMLYQRPLWLQPSWQTLPIACHDIQRKPPFSTCLRRSPKDSATGSVVRL